MRRAIIIGALIGVLTVASLVSPMFLGTAKAAQYSPPWADRFTAVFPSPRWGWPPIDTTTYDPQWLSEIGGIGYQANSWPNSFAKFATNSKMPADAVFSSITHGSPGYLFFYNPTYKWTCVRADDGMSWPSGVNTTWSSSLNETPDLWDVRLIAFVGCETAVPQSGIDYRSLTIQAVNYQGVDCAVGFDTTIVATRAVYWDYLFWNRMSTSHTVQQSCIVATQLTYVNYGDYGGTNNWDIAGNSGITIVPAAYGT